MIKRQYSDEFKEQILKECQETGNVALVARRHEISPNTIHTWIKLIFRTLKAKNMSIIYGTNYWKLKRSRRPDINIHIKTSQRNHSRLTGIIIRQITSYLIMFFNK